MRLKAAGWMLAWLLSSHCAVATVPSVLEAERAERGKGILIRSHPNEAHKPQARQVRRERQRL